jgi:hypothetical protein
MAFGVDFFPGYVWGRAAALGEPPTVVVAATFGVFEPSLIGAVYEAGAAAVPRADILDARCAGAVASLETVATPRECSAIADPLLDVLDGLEGLGRPLFSALRALERPDSPAGRLWRAAELVREHRGDGHLAALVAAGVGAAEANVLTERWLGFDLGEYSGTRGFSPDAIAVAAAELERRGWLSDGDVTEVGRAARSTIEAATDTSQHRLVEACGADLAAIVDGAAAISTRLIDAHSFPADPRKRAGG